jgi:hypothetical protein
MAAAMPTVTDAYNAAVRRADSTTVLPLNVAVTYEIYVCSS